MRQAAWWLAFLTAAIGTALLLPGAGGGWPAIGPRPALAQTPDPLRPAAPSKTPEKPALTPHGPGELECRNCHVGEHQGVVRMYLGLGGRGAPQIPSHMLQVRVECIACHISPKDEAAKAALVGQTFRPTEQACVGCHGEKYRGMLARWITTLGRMQEMLAPKLAAAQSALAAADAKGPKVSRARQLVEDANFNVRFVTLGKGVHNVFYAADLLKLSNAWLDEALGLVDRAPGKASEPLVRGGYCGVLCHEQAGVKLKETVVFANQRLPHGRHVTEFGATCTACHSADVHKAVTATAATCVACHHDPQNDRCESCHRVQSAFYRGTLGTEFAKAEPNVMAEAVGCTGCHDFTAKHSRQVVGQKCVGCHEAPYKILAAEWTEGFDKDAARTSRALKRAAAAMAAARRTGGVPTEATRLAQEARTALALIQKARGAHNPAMAGALLDEAQRKAEAALALLKAR
jgi:hypothetical protein